MMSVKGLQKGLTGEGNVASLDSNHSRATQHDQEKW